MTEEARSKFQKLLQRRDQLYQWYQEKQSRGFHKEFSFEYLKSQIVRVENEIDSFDANADTTTTNSSL